MLLAVFFSLHVPPLVSPALAGCAAAAPPATMHEEEPGVPVAAADRSKRPRAQEQAAAKGSEQQPFDMDELIARLKKTKAIGFLTKLTLRSDAMELIEMVRRYRKEDSPAQLKRLRARFEGLLLKVLALLDDDPGLRHDIVAQRERIWQSLLEVKT